MISLTTSERKAIHSNVCEIYTYSDIFESVSEGIQVFFSHALQGTDVLVEWSLRELASTFCDYGARFRPDWKRDMDLVQFRNSIHRNALGMKPEAALSYVMALKEAHKISAPIKIRNHFNHPADLWDPEAFQQKVQDIIADSGEFSLEERIERIIDTLHPALLVSPLLQNWDEDFIDAAWEGNLCETLSIFEEHSHDFSENHAIHMAAIYAEVIRGRIFGLSEQTTPVQFLQNERWFPYGNEL